MDGDKYQVRKLVKKDRDISTYSFVSFQIRCSADLFGALIDSNKWPSSCWIRKFNFEQRTSNIVKLTNPVSLKNGGMTNNDQNLSKNELSCNEMETLENMETNSAC